MISLSCFNSFRSFPTGHWGMSRCGTISALRLQLRRIKRPSTHSVGPRRSVVTHAQRRPALWPRRCRVDFRGRGSRSYREFGMLPSASSVVSKGSNVFRCRCAAYRHSRRADNGLQFTSDWPRTAVFSSAGAVMRRRATQPVSGLFQLSTASLWWCRQRSAGDAGR
ncbi:hypothetical protein B0I37DRAFT_152277 [Chaetomium sp. MPI-CAGE-AT-0009]|nr:hypothetical protein B0I37DRAFT_152277 [Chaetomium sp. MPI-CAGE-AT-0009]